MKNFLKALVLRIAAVALSLALPLLVAEGLLRLLPVSTGLATLPVNAAAPIFHFAPNRDFIWSRDWNFTTVNRGRTNNDGFVNAQDFTKEGIRPLIGVVGDSFVEALMVPYAQTFHGRMAAELAGKTRVYSFAGSGAPLSQYLVWMRHARRAYDVDRLVVMVVGNDFDESLAEYKIGPGFHHYVEDNGELVLRRFDFMPDAMRGVVRKSALARYLLLHLHADSTLRTLLPRLGIAAAHADPQPAFVGNVPSVVDSHRLVQSERAIGAFFRDLPAYADLPPPRVLFVVDGLRYPKHAAETGSYFARMRTRFMDEARRRGYAVIDTDTIFMPYAAAHPDARFEWPTDGHWNPLAHGLVAQAILRSPWVEGLGD